MGKKGQSCANCLYWAVPYKHPHGDWLAACCKNPPVATDMRNLSICPSNALFPVTFGTTWCGEWKKGVDKTKGDGE